MTLHLLRGFVQWFDRLGDHAPIKTVDEAEVYVRGIAELGFERFYTETTRRVTRAAELEGGSVYFVGGPKRNQALFRMPLVRIEGEDGDWAICMRPELIRVRQDAVGRVRGWRYLRDGDAPPDLLAPATGDEPPPEMARELKEMGLA